MRKNNSYLDSRVRIDGSLEFDTAFHIGSGREGLMATDMGVLLDQHDRPILPGSSLKGNFRSQAERLAPHLGLSACLLDSSLSGISCVTDETYRRSHHDEFNALEGDSERLSWLADHTCDICALFGSPYQGGRIFFSDGVLTADSLSSVQVRDGVCINRDSGTVVHGMKFDYEVVSSDISYSISIELENPSDPELALVGAVLAEWRQGFRIGGFTSRGLGKVKLLDPTISRVNYRDPSQLKEYLLNRRMSESPDLLNDCLSRQLTLGGDNA